MRFTVHYSTPSSVYCSIGTSDDDWGCRLCGLQVDMLLDIGIVLVWVLDSRGLQWSEGVLVSSGQLRLCQDVLWCPMCNLDSSFNDFIWTIIWWLEEWMDGTMPDINRCAQWEITTTIHRTNECIWFGFKTVSCNKVHIWSNMTKCELCLVKHRVQS